MDVLSRHRLKDVIDEGGIPFNRAHGMHLFEYCDNDSRFNEVFNNAMFNHTSLVMKKILESYNGFEHVKILVDVGGGTGVNLNIITSKYPHIKGVNLDLPHVIQDAPSYPGIFSVNFYDCLLILLLWVLLLVTMKFVNSLMIHESTYIYCRRGTYRRGYVRKSSRWGCHFNEGN